MQVKRLHHAGLTVSNMERSIDFYRGVVGAELLCVGDSRRQGVPLGEFQNAVEVKRAKLRYAFLKYADTKMELICYTSPRGKEEKRRHNDIGTPHIAFEVVDIDKAYDELSRKGAKFLNAPVEVRGPKGTWCKGWRFTYFAGPDGELIEIFQEIH